MTFVKTGKKWTQEHEESLQLCDQCDKSLTIDQYRSEGHWNVTFDPEQRYGDGDDYETFDFCSLECMAAWALEGGRRHGRLTPAVDMR